jgi:hypothetical protein
MAGKVRVGAGEGGSDPLLAQEAFLSGEAAALALLHSLV